jgi:hypothetical protein
MRRMTLATAALLTAVSLAAPLGATPQPPKPKKPRLDLRASPRFAFSPVNIFLTAELQGGEDVEAFYCPELEWDWDDGGKSVHEADCAPFEPGVSKIERRFTADHEYRNAGVYTVKVTMRRNNNQIAVANVRVTVRAGLGDKTIERE